MVVFTLSMGHAAFGTEMSIASIVSDVRIEKNVRVTVDGEPGTFDMLFMDIEVLNTELMNIEINEAVISELYNDGKKVNSLDIIGWGEWCNGYQIVKYTESKSFLPAKGYWCKYDNDQRVAILAQFMYKTFPAYTSSKALGPIYGDYLSKSIAEFQRRTGLYPDGMTGQLTYNKLKEYGFKY